MRNRRLRGGGCSRRGSPRLARLPRRRGALSTASFHCNSRQRRAGRSSHSLSSREGAGTRVLLTSTEVVLGLRAAGAVAPYRDAGARALPARARTRTAGRCCGCGWPARIPRPEWARSRRASGQGQPLLREGPGELANGHPHVPTSPIRRGLFRHRSRSSTEHNTRSSTTSWSLRRRPGKQSRWTSRAPRISESTPKATLSSWRAAGSIRFRKPEIYQDRGAIGTEGPCGRLPALRAEIESAST